MQFRTSNHASYSEFVYRTRTWKSAPSKSGRFVMSTSFLIEPDPNASDVRQWLGNTGGVVLKSVRDI